jgi:hypothetical protein
MTFLRCVLDPKWWGVPAPSRPRRQGLEDLTFRLRTLQIGWKVSRFITVSRAITYSSVRQVRGVFPTHVHSKSAAKSMGLQ